MSFAKHHAVGHKKPPHAVKKAQHKKHTATHHPAHLHTHAARHISTTPGRTASAFHTAHTTTPTAASMLKQRCRKFATLSAHLPDDDVSKLLPPRLVSGPMLDYNFMDLPMSMPKAAWDASIQQYRKFFAVDKSIELLSDMDKADTPEVKNRCRKLLALSPDLIPADEAASFEMVKLQKEFSRLEPIHEVFETFLKMRLEYADLTEMRVDTHAEFERATRENNQDEVAEWHAVLTQTDTDLFNIKKSVPEREEKLMQYVLPVDADDNRNAILEIRPGAGGDEAAIFAGELFHMYEKLCQNNNMRFSVDYIHYFDSSGSEAYKEAVATISGDDVFGFLKYETGVHRVQRIPATESQGRVHTSTVTVAVMPEATEVDVEIREQDIRVDLYRASGAGGQHVNTTDSAVRLTHIPTGIVVQNQDERNQHKNKEKAMKMLRSRILEIRRQAIAEERARLKGSQIGTGDRNERIRTYNFPQDRVTDHRCNVTLNNIAAFMRGEEGLDQIQQKLSLIERLDILLAENAPPPVVSDKDDKKKGKKK